MFRFGLVAGLLLLAACSGDDTVDTTSPPTTTTTVAETTTTTTIAETTTTTGIDLGGAVGPDTPGVATATVQIIQLQSGSGSLEFGCFSGSGSIIREDGLVLTNAHVVENDPSCPYDTIGIAVLEAADEPPELRYLADLLVIDPALDLAIVQIAADLEGAPVAGEFPFLALGDSEQVDLGDPIRVLGYPAIGGDTITLTRGAVSGFTEERNVEGRAWIKTDATITGGNSGGAAVNENGQLVGVPTIAGSGANVDPTDCRVIQDTNGDGFLDEADTCVAIGGFINGLRPINLARALIGAADGATPIPIQPSTTPTTVVTVTDADVGPISFSTGVTDDDQPVDRVLAIPSNAAGRVCGFWDYDGLANGVRWDALWYLGGEFIEEASFIDAEWIGGESGNWWVCFVGPNGRLQDGTYELVLNVAGELAATEAIMVGGEPTIMTLELANESFDEICFVRISLSEAQSWGPDELGPTETIPPGALRIFELPGGIYDFQVFDCNADLIIEEFFFDLTESRVYTLAG